MKGHVCKIYNQPYIYLFRRPVSFVFLAYFVFYNSEAVDVDIWDRVRHLSFYINIMSAGSQQLVDVIELSPIKILVCVRWINTWYWLALAEPTRDIILDLSEHTENFRKDSSKVPQHNQIMIEMSNPNQEPPSSSKAPNEYLKDIDVLCTFKIKREPKFGSCVYQRPMTISKSRSRSQTSARNPQHP